MPIKKPDYGFDAPKAIAIFLSIACIQLVALALMIYFIVPINRIIGWVMASIFLIGFVSTLYPIITIIRGSRILKFRERDWLFSHLQIKGNEQILDVGCGRGLLLIAAAKKLNTGKAVGIDIWSSADLSGNELKTTMHNARSEGVENKVEVITADARAMPFEDDSFDIVLSSWALHNIHGQLDRKKALREIARVLKPGGTVALMDIVTCDEYTSFFITSGFNAIHMHGPRHTFGNKTYLIMARKPQFL